MSKEAKKLDAPHPAKNDSAPSREAATQDGTNSQSTTLDALRAKCQSIIRRMDECPQAFAAFVAHISEHIAANPMWTYGSDELRRFIGGKEFTDSKGRTFSVRHGHDAVFMRELCRRHPNIAPHILPTLRHSKFDIFYRGSIFSDAYISALADANAHPELLEV